MNLNELSSLDHYPIIGSTWKHYKTEGLYKVIGIGIHTEDDENVIIYQDMNNQKIWVRPFRKKNDKDPRSCWNDLIRPGIYRFELVN